MSALRSSLRWLGVVAVSAGCAPSNDGPAPIAPMADAGGAPDAGSERCLPAPEICNGIDDDCDLAIDEETDRECSALPNAFAACVGGRCAVVRCPRGWDDCNGDPTDGCETSVTSLAQCGACDAPCDATCCDATCTDIATDPGHCGACGQGCLGAMPGCCDGYCVDFATDQENCGACGRACDGTHGEVACVDGDCRVAGCGIGFDDCNLDAEDGCETPIATTSDCGACGRSCGGEGPACCEGICRDVATDLAHCGACDAPCELANATERCEGGACVVAACDRGFGDCNPVPEDGCEQPLDDPAHCGTCGHACGPDEECVGDTCRASSVVDLELGLLGACAVRATSTVWCWSHGSTAELVSSLPADIVRVAVGDRHTCAVSAAGGLHCWGANDSGQRGDCTTTATAVPVRVSGIDLVADVALGHDFSCAATGTGAVRCWGRGEWGQLGNGSSGSAVASACPVTVSLPEPASTVTAGFQHACAIGASGRAYCWGRNDSGELGAGSSAILSATPLPVAALAGARSVSAGRVHTCAAASDGSAACWGDGRFGQLGDGSSGIGTKSNVPVTVVGLGGSVSRIRAAGRINGASMIAHHSCALGTGGAVHCWGRNDVGQLAADASITLSAAPLAVAVPAASVLASGGRSNCVVSSAGVRCWGEGYGAVPVAVGGLP